MPPSDNGNQGLSAPKELICKPIKLLNQVSHSGPKPDNYDDQRYVGSYTDSNQRYDIYTNGHLVLVVECHTARFTFDELYMSYRRLIHDDIKEFKDIYDQAIGMVLMALGNRFYSRKHVANAIALMIMDDDTHLQPEDGYVVDSDDLASSIEKLL